MRISFPREAGTALEARVESAQTGGPADGERQPFWFSAAGFAVAAIVIGLFAVEVWQKLGTGMTGFYLTWYHGPFAAVFAATGETFSLHFVAPQFLSRFYPQNSELVHGLGILGFGNDLLSPLINLGWLAGCLLAAWAIGRPYGGAPISLAGVALVLGPPRWPIRREQAEMTSSDCSSCWPASRCWSMRVLSIGTTAAVGLASDRSW